jgi:hypothetical protein
MQNPNQGAGAAAAAGQQVPPPQPQGQAAPRRARNPVKWSQQAKLDYDNKQDHDYYKIATEKLEGDPYDGKNLSLFLKKLERKAQQFN